MAAATPSLTNQPCQPSADASSSALVPPSSLCTPPHSQETPWSPTPHCVPIFTEEVDNTSVDMKEYEAVAINPEYKFTVQDKLKEAIECGKKLDFESVVSLIQNHPWEESKEMQENEYFYGDFENDDYQGEEIT